MRLKSRKSVINSGFADLIAPVSQEIFFAENWETKPLHVRRGDDRFYERILTKPDLEAIVSSGGLRFPAIQLAKGGAFFPPEAFTRTIRSGEDIFSGVPDLERVQAEYRAGATISLPGLHRAWRSVGRLVATLEAGFGHAVHANAYLTPANAPGFSPHYDTHEVLVLQIAGDKHWRIYPPPLPLPHRTQPFSPRHYTPPATPLLELDLAPGDILYLPRGYVHTTSTSNASSAHLTIGITVYTWIDLAAELLQYCKSEERFRRSLPPGFAASDDAETALRDGLAGLAEYLSRTDGHDRLLDEFIRRAGRRETASAFRMDTALPGPLTRLAPLAGDRYKMDMDGDNIVLQFDGKTVALAKRTYMTLRAMCGNACFCVADLPQHLDEEETLVLARYLHDQGFLSVVE